jgi:hypothetical protein
MFGFFKKREKYDWKKEHVKLWKALVPINGPAETLQGELIRLAGKLTDQAYRNGNMNWDEHYPISWRFIGQKISNDGTFSQQEKRQIKESIEEIIRDFDHPDLSGTGSAYYVISERVVDWCMANPKPIALEEGLDLIM